MVHTKNSSVFIILVWVWATNIIEVARDDTRDIHDSKRNTRTHKKCGSVSLVAHVLEACDPKTYAYAHGQLDLENDMAIGYHFLIKIKLGN